MRLRVRHGVGIVLTAGMTIVMPAVGFAQTASVHGQVVSHADGAPIASAEIRHLVSGVRVRSDAKGRFSIAARPGDSLLVRVLGYRERRMAVSADAMATEWRASLVPLATVLPVFTTTMGQRVIRANESPRSVTVVDRKDIDATAAVSANQLLRQLPGMQELPAPPSKTSVSIRGFDDSRVLVLVDGEPVAGRTRKRMNVGPSSGGPSIVASSP
ncbi:MAG: hypothetical protein EBV77_00825 [Gemmatimonadaceae bacterium]|nr:hypothetical protein [Gemmatimonadaceae bacterium]